MNKAVEVILTSPTGDFPTISPVAVRINYSLEDVPTAILDLAPASLALFCDFEKFRRARVHLLVRTVNGCISFDGLIDGLSMSQSVGGLSIQLVIKSVWQVLKEIDSRIPGYNPNSTDIFKQVPMVNLQGTAESPSLIGNLRLSQLHAMSFGLPAIKGIVELLKVMLNVQFDARTIVTEPNYQYALVRIAEVLKTSHIELALEKLENVVTTFAEKTKITLLHYISMCNLLGAVTEAKGSLYDLLMRLLGLFECTLVVGNKYAYVVPKIGFLKMNHTNVGLRQVSSTPNVVYPAQYNSFSFNDSGYTDIRAVALRAPAVMPMVGLSISSEIGFYADPNARGGVLVMDTPTFVALGGSLLDSSFQDQIRQNVAADAPNTAPGTASPPSAEQAAKELSDKTKKAENLRNIRSEKQRTTLLEYCNEWAQIKYYQTKYSDRVGNFTTLFNPNFAPGAVGQLYTRHPGTYIDFFVTGVTHSLSLSPAAQGEAITTVSFNSGRVGANALATGVDRVTFFDYSAETSLEYARQFVNDVSSE